MAGPPYALTYEGGFFLPAPPEEVWSVLRRLDRFESWWGWLSELQVEGAGLETGAVLRLVVAPPLPYRIRVRVELVECVRPSRIVAAVSGDLDGRGQLVLEPEGTGSRATVASSIEARQRPLRAAARLAPGLLRWGHDRVVESTVRSFRARLREEAEGS